MSRVRAHYGRMRPDSRSGVTVEPSGRRLTEEEQRTRIAREEALDRARAGETLPHLEASQ